MLLVKTPTAAKKSGVHKPKLNLLQSLEKYLIAFGY
jgi:hypothetical protein